MIYSAVLLIEAFLIYETNRRISTTSAVMLVLWYLFFSQLYFLYRAVNFATSDLMPGFLGAYYFHTQFGLIAYFSIFSFVYVSTLGVSQKKSKISININNNILLLSSLFIYSFTGLVVTIRISSIDPMILMSNSSYLLLNSEAAIANLNPLTTFVSSAMGTISLVCALVAAVNFSKGNLKFAVIGFLLAAPHIVISFSGASRAAAVPMAAISITLMALSKSRTHKFFAILAALSVIVIFLSANYGRSQGRFGLAHIRDQFGWVSDMTRIDFQSSFLNSLFQGIFSTTDAMMISADFNNNYKILSFSPLPSFIDGFEQIRRNSEIRLHEYVPMSAMAELYHFGLPFIAIYAFILFFSFRLSAKIDLAERPLLGISTSITIATLFITAQTYPLRNTFRPIFLIFIILALLPKNKSVKSKVDQNARTRFPLG